VQPFVKVRSRKPEMLTLMSKLSKLQIRQRIQAQWHMPGIPATQDLKVRKILSEKQNKNVAHGLHFQF
jgi:hypothetical protein